MASDTPYLVVEGKLQSKTLMLTVSCPEGQHGKFYGSAESGNYVTVSLSGNELAAFKHAIDEAWEQFALNEVKYRLNG